MKKISSFIAKKHIFFFVLGLVLLIPAFVGKIFTPINYDIFSYLPEDVESIRGQLIMQQTYNSADTAFIMFESKETPEILNLKERILKVNGVESVAWVDDIVSPAIPDFMMPEELTGIYKKDNVALLHVSFMEASASEITQAAVTEIKQIIGDEPAFTGMPAFVSELKTLVEDQKVKSVIWAIVISALVIALLTGSFITPIIFLVSIGVGIMYNLGTNFIFGSVSYLTEAVAAVIQLGVTFDFSIFLMNRYKEEFRKTNDHIEAMSHAISMTITAIVPAALTTIAGFMALSLMQVRIGLDMGLVLSKGVLLGLVVSVTFLPSAVLIFRKFLRIRDTANIELKLRGFASKLVKYHVPIATLFVILFIPAVIGRFGTDLSYNVRAMLPADLEAMKAIEKIEDNVGSVETANIIFYDEVPSWKVQELSEKLEALPSVNRSVSIASLVDPSLPDWFVPEQAKQKFIRDGYNSMILQLSIDPGTEEGNQAVEDIRACIKSEGFDNAIVSGLASTSYDLMQLSSRDIEIVNLFSFLAILLIVTIVFMSGSIPIILIAGIQLAIFINLAIPYYLGQTVPYLTFTSISAIQLGTTVDYAILLMSRYKEERRFADKNEAMIKTISGSLPSIFISGISLFAATISLVFVSDVETIQSLAAMIARGALISMSIIILLVPAVILVCDKIIIHTSVGWKVKDKKTIFSKRRLEVLENE
ncbi:MAG: MMPL family transporter [Spirochaetales bacterium]|nr:MMPL family transporter [Spirochaetales bacterium]